MKILSCLSLEESQEAAEQVLRLESHFDDRKHFHTLGGAVYLDKGYPDEYYGRAKEVNPFLMHNFKSIYVKILEKLEDEIGVPMCWHPIASVPGFHIFRESKAVPSFHVDTPHKEVMWPEQIHSMFSFTVPLALPEEGGGLEVGFSLEYIPYVLGHVYLHDGCTPHRISPKYRSSEEHPRITVQGHGAIIKDTNVALVYF